MGKVHFKELFFYISGQIALQTKNLIKVKFISRLIFHIFVSQTFSYPPCYLSNISYILYFNTSIGLTTYVGMQIWGGDCDDPSLPQVGLIVKGLNDTFFWWPPFEFPPVTTFFVRPCISKYVCLSI